MSRILSPLVLAFAATLGGVVEIDPMDNPAFGWNSANVDVCYNPVDDEYLAVWSDWGWNDEFMALTSGLTGRRIDAATGDPIGGPFAIEPHEYYAREFYDVAIAHDPASNLYMVAYSLHWYFGSSNQVDARFITGAGEVLGISPTRVGGDSHNESLYANHPDVAFDGKRFLAVWEQRDIYTSAPGAILGRFFDPETLAPGAEFEIEDTAADGANPSLAPLEGSDACLVVYAESPTGLEARTIRSRVVISDGTLQAIETLSGKAGNNTWPRVAAATTGKEWLVAWERNDSTDSWAGSDFSGSAPAGSSTVEYRRVKWSAGDAVPQGSGGTDLASPAAVNVAPSVAWSAIDNHYVLNWQEGALFSGTTGIRGASVSALTGEIVSGSESLVSEGGVDEFCPASAARTGTKEVFTAWGTLVMEIGAGVQGVRSATAPAVIPTETPTPAPSPDPLPAGDGGSSGGCGGSAGADRSIAALALAVIGLRILRRGR